MDKQVDDMVPGHIKLVEIIIKCKRKRTDRAAGQFPPPPVSRVIQPPYPVIIDDTGKIIKLKWTFNRVWVTEQPQQDDDR